MRVGCNAMVGGILVTGEGGGGGCPISISGMEVGEVMVMKHLQCGRVAQKSRRGQKGGCTAKEEQIRRWGRRKTGCVSFLIWNLIVVLHCAARSFAGWSQSTKLSFGSA